MAATSKIRSHRSHSLNSQCPMTPAIRVLEKAKVPFALHRYDHDPAAESFGLEAAAALGVAPERVFKTLVARADGALWFALVPAAAHLDLKKLAKAVNAKRTEMADPAAAERATGYVLGGISPLGGKKTLPAVVDCSALGHATVYVSAGRRGLQLELAPRDLIELTRAATADIAAS